MRTTLNLPDALVFEAKMRALHDGATLTDLLVQGLRLRLDKGQTPRGLPVSKASGGLCPGIDWNKLQEANGQGQDYR